MSYLVKSNGSVKRNISILGDSLKFMESLTYSFSNGHQEKAVLKAGCEGIIVILDGALEVAIGGEAFEMTRKNVFDDLPEAVFVSDGTEDLDINIKCLEDNTRIIYVQALIDEDKRANTSKREISFINKSDVDCFDRGGGQFKREIRNVGVNNINAKSIICGETINPPGNWSSFPPHKHDEKIDGVESLHEEVYVFSSDVPEKGWGYQELYCYERDFSHTYRVQHNDAVIIPFGYHPVAAAPGYKLHYFWILAGRDRDLQMHDDPNHTWIRQEM